jgi:hypothetical protein
MAGKSARDKCFKEATDAYNDTHDDKINIEHQKPWVQENGVWRPLGVAESIWNFIRGTNLPYRYPDWTLTMDGTPVAGDNKFSGDAFDANRVSKRSGNTQLQDQNNMNEDQSPGKNEHQDLNLNEDKCKCDDENPPRENVPVKVPSLSPFMVPGVNPITGGVVIPGGAGAGVGVGGLGGLVPAW